jgi:alpha-beta hydrolase superfamily lysophospholipase
MPSFTGSGNQEISFHLDIPAGEARAYAIFAHCFTCSKESKAAAYISRALAGRGIAVMRLDFTSLEFSSNLDDLADAAAYLRREHRAPQLLIGHSLGGAAVLAAAGRIPGAAAIATIGAPFEPKHVLHLIKGEIQQETTVDIGGRPFRVRKQFVDDLARQDPARHIGELRKALLIMHAPGDATVGIDNAAKIFMAARHPKSFVSLDGADHLLTNARDAAYAAEVLAAWSSRYLS